MRLEKSIGPLMLLLSICLIKKISIIYTKNISIKIEFECDDFIKPGLLSENFLEKRKFNKIYDI